MKIFITGGAGFIGSHLVEHHLKKGNEVWSVDNLATGQQSNLFHGVRFDEGELCSYPNLEEAVEWADQVFHTAATIGMMRVINNPIKTLCNNIHSTESVLQAVGKSKKKPHLLITSTSGVYCHVPFEKEYREDVNLVVPSGEYKQECYSLGKIVNEVMALGYSDQYHFPCTIARLFNTIGPRQTGKYGMVAPRFVAQALKGEPITVYGDGMQTRSFCCVYDTVRGLDLLMENPKSCGKIYNVGNHTKEITILEFAKLVKERLKSSSEIQFVPYKEAFGFDFEDVLHRRPSIEKIHALTGFTPEWSLEQTIDAIANFCRAHLLSSSQ